MNDWRNPLPGVPDVESPFFEDIFARKQGEPGWIDIARSLHEHGYAVFDFQQEDLDASIDSIIAGLGGSFDLEAWRAEGWQTGESIRAQDAWRYHDAVRRIAVNDYVLRLLTYLYGRTAWPFQTLNFPVGTQQHFHSDSIHFSSMPERFMCGVWLALEDTDEANGPLVYYPGSHKLPIYVSEHIGHFAENPGYTAQRTFEPMWRELVRVKGLERRRFHARKGQALIWAANLLHGGERQLDPFRTRWSQVTHYYFDDCVYYTPLHSDIPYGRALIRQMTDIQTESVKPNRYLGRDMPADFVQRLTHGREIFSRTPADFIPADYLAQNPDVAAAGVDPGEHFLAFGQFEGRTWKRS